MTTQRSAENGKLALLEGPEHRVSGRLLKTFFSMFILPGYDVFVFETWGQGSALLQALWEEIASGIPGTTRYRQDTTQGLI